MDLDGAHVLVTGASRGIGAAMARRFAGRGARLSLVARSADPLARLADELNGRSFPTDLLDPGQVDDLVPRVEGRAGPIDVLVNNAGIATTRWFDSLDPDQVRAVARVNLEAPMMLTRAVVPSMLDRGRGHLVYTASLAGTGGFPALAAYGATKAGLMNFAAALRLELKDTPLGTTVVAPGPVDTDMWGLLEQENDLGPTITRLRRLLLLPRKSPDLIARRTVDAVANGRRHVRTPRRLSVNFWMREGPTRLTELALKGVPTGPRSG